jgi:hypothetical protein
MSAAADTLEILEPSGSLMAADIARIVGEQRESNLRAVRQHAIECQSRVIVPPALLRAVSYWDGDAPAVERGLAALDHLACLIASSGLSIIAEEKADIWIHEARAALQRFQTPWGPA